MSPRHLEEGGWRSRQTSLKLTYRSQAKERDRQPERPHVLQRIRSRARSIRLSPRSVRQADRCYRLPPSFCDLSRPAVLVCRGMRGKQNWDFTVLSSSRQVVITTPSRHTYHIAISDHPLFVFLLQ